jgi:tetrapyrrole methylase family protein/MazG family protein/ATP diphosphatase
MGTTAEKEQHVAPFQRLGFIVKTLRGSHGCPWDQKQTPVSLKKYLLEETRELAEAIEQGDTKHICEETGDLYFILALLTAIFEEYDEFSANDALNDICEKMVRRHPHVFEQNKNCSEKELQAQWERIKEQEKSQK